MYDIDEKQDRNDIAASLDTGSPGSYEKYDAPPTPARQRIRRHFGLEIRDVNVDIVLLLCWFMTGLLDSTIYNAYRTFVSMQTGNTMFIGLGASNYNTTTRPYSWARSLVSMIFFLAGCYFFPRFSRRFGGLRRGTLTMSFLLQSALILLPAIFVESNVVEGRLEHIGDEMDWRHLIPIALLSFQAPGQCCLCRDLSLLEVPTLVVTTVMYDFASDPKLHAPLKQNPVRNRRFVGFVMIMLGAISGGWVTKKSGHIMISLWTTAAVKAVIAIAWIFWPAKAEDTRRWIC